MLDPLEAAIAKAAHNTEIDRLSAEHAAKDARIASLERRCTTSEAAHSDTIDDLNRLRAVTATANARIAELEKAKADSDYVWGAPTADLMDWQDKAKRTERAEAELVATRENYRRLRADMADRGLALERAEAERDAMREAGTAALKDLEYFSRREGPGGDASRFASIYKLRAALAPPPAGQETQWLSNAERQKDGIDKSEVEFFGELRVRAGRPFPPTSRTSPMRSCTCGLIIGSCSCPADPSPAGREG